MDLNTKNEIMLRYKSGADLYHFFSVVSKCPPQLTAGVVDAHLPTK
jgi:hypothetical protein